jgi:hypothetical protein
MVRPELDKIIRSSTTILHRGRYAYLQVKGKENLGEHFLVSQDKDEVTVITEEANVSKVRYTKEVKWFKLIEVRIAAEFTKTDYWAKLLGFWATVTGAIADAGLNILTVSTFSKDYMLIREEKIDIAVAALKKLGFSVEEE